MGRFSAQVKGFSRLAKRRQNLIFHRSLDLVTSELLDITKVVTGNLRRSLMASTLSMPQFKPDVEFSADSGGAVALVIATSKMGAPFYFGYQAAYAARWNYGFTGSDSLGRSFNQSGSGAVEAAALKWVGFVKQAERELGGK